MPYNEIKRIAQQEEIIRLIETGQIYEVKEVKEHCVIAQDGSFSTKIEHDKYVVLEDSRLQDSIEQAAKVMFESAWSCWSFVLSDFTNMKLFNDLNNPKVGDYVFENTNPFVPYKSRIGKLIEKSESRSHYIIEKLDGRLMEWENAKFIKVADEETRKLMKR